MQNPVFTPTNCFACQTHRHERGFVDLLAEDSGGLHLYLCAGCVDAATRVVGGLDPRQASELESRVHVAEMTMEDIRERLEEEKQNKVVDLDTVRRLVGEIRKTPQKRPTAPAA